MKDWPSVALGDIFEIARGGSPRPIQNFLTEEPDGVNWVMIGDASDSSKYITHTKKRILKTGVKNSRMVYPGDFLLTNSMSFGHPYIMKTSGCIHDGWLVLSNKKGVIDQDYFYHLLGSDLIYAEFSRLASGSTVKNLNIEIVKGIKVSLPPLEEQRRIAAILDKADGVRRKRKEAIRLTEELLKSTFLEMFGYSSDESVSIGELLDKGVLLLHKDGNHGSNYPRTSEFGIEGIPFLSANCFSDSGEMITDNVKFLSESKANKLKIGWLEHSDVLLAHNATVGRVALYDGRYKQALVGTSLTIFRPHREYLLPEFLFGVLRSEMFQKQLAHNMEQSTRNQVPITAQRDLKIKLAPLKKQLKFKELFHHVMNISKKYESSNQESENLFNSLLQKAFRGEL